MHPGLVGDASKLRCSPVLLHCQPHLHKEGLRLSRRSVVVSKAERASYCCAGRSRTQPAGPKRQKIEPVRMRCTPPRQHCGWSRTPTSAPAACLTKYISASRPRHSRPSKNALRRLFWGKNMRLRCIRRFPVEQTRSWWQRFGCAVKKVGTNTRTDAPACADQTRDDVEHAGVVS